MGTPDVTPETLIEMQAIELGVMPVGRAEQIMQHAVEQRRLGLIPDLLLFLAHPRSVSLGLKNRADGQPEDLLVPVSRLKRERIELVRSERGGGITYHWPGQIVMYPVMELGPHERNIPDFMAKLEHAIIESLRIFRVETFTSRETPAHVGLWFRGRKVVSMGIRVDHWITSFGAAVNLEGDHHPSRYVRPCGIPDAELITLREILGAAPPRQWVIQAMKKRFSMAFKRQITDGDPSLLDNLCTAAPDAKVCVKRAKEVART